MIVELCDYWIVVLMKNIDNFCMQNYF